MLNQLVNSVGLAPRAKWSVSELAKIFGVSVRTLHRYFLKYEGKTPKDWLAEQRYRQASKMLRDGATIKETAFCVGYKHQTNFTRQYKRRSGACPSLQRTPSKLTTPFLSDNDQQCPKRISYCP